MATTPTVAATRALPRRVHNPVQRDTATFLQTAEESGGRRTLLEIELAPGGGNEPHRHLSYAETFRVLDGTVAVRVGPTHRHLGPGDTTSVPAGTVHCFHNPGRQPATFRVALEPGHEGFERAIRVGYGLAADGRTRADGLPRDPLQLALLMQWSDIRLVGAGRLLGPAVGVLARVAMRRGIDRELVERYCTPSVRSPSGP